MQRVLRQRARKAQPPARAGSRFLLSGLLHCGRCGKAYVGHAAKSGQFAYYVCNTLHRAGACACDGRYLNAARLEELVVGQVMTRILNEQTIIQLVQLVAEEIDAMAAELAGQVEAVEAELADVRRRLERLYDALENSDLTYAALAPRILSLRGREDQLAAARDDAVRRLEQRRSDLPSTDEIHRYVADFQAFLQAGTIPERKALIRNFIKAIKIANGEAILTYTIPMPSDGATRDGIGVLDFVQSSPPNWTKSTTFTLTVVLDLRAKPLPIREPSQHMDCG